MARIMYYMAHDPISNTEGVITEYDQDTIKSAADSGIVFIAVDSDGARSIVSAEEVKEPESKDSNFVIVQPQYVDDRMKAAISVFDALGSAVFPSADAETQSANGVRKAARAITPEAAFESALEALKKIVFGGDDE